MVATPAKRRPRRDSPGHVNIEEHGYGDWRVMIRQGEQFHVGAGKTVREAAENLCRHLKIGAFTGP
jgi:hypothetical protein